MTTKTETPLTRLVRETRAALLAQIDAHGDLDAARADFASLDRPTADSLARILRGMHGRPRHEADSRPFGGRAMKVARYIAALLLAELLLAVFCCWSAWP